MTRRYFASIAIRRSLTTVRIRRPKKPPKRIAVVDLGSAGHRPASTRVAANYIKHKILHLHDFFPRLRLGADSCVKPGKEDRTTTPPTKQQHLSGTFPLSLPKYAPQNLAVWS